MYIETTIRVNFETELGDDFDNSTPQEEIDRAIQEHIKDYAEEHNLSLNDIEVITKEI